jgi:hypothetical protein
MIWQQVATFRGGSSVTRGLPSMKKSSTGEQWLPMSIVAVRANSEAAYLYESNTSHCCGDSTFPVLVVLGVTSRDNCG